MRPAFDKMRTFVPAKDYALSKQFYAELFELVWDGGNVCEFRVGSCTFFLQNFYVAEFANNSMYEMSCANARSTWEYLSTLIEKYPGTSVSPPKQQPWGLVVDLVGPAGELWHVTERSP